MGATRINASRSLVAAGLAGAVVAGIGAGSASATGPARQRAAKLSSITIASTLQIPSLNGILENLVPSNDTIYDPLVRIGPDGSLQKALATNWKSNGKATVWIFTLRRGVKFSNGSPLTVQDVIWTYQTIESTPTSMNHSYLGDVASITRAGSDEVVFNLKAPFAAWPRQTSLIPIVSQSAYTSEGATNFASRPVGTGPYKVVGFTPNEQVVLAANGSYWGGAPPIKKVIEEWIPDARAPVKSDL